MTQFNLSIADYASLSALMLLVVGGQYAIGSAQIEASEARLGAEIRVQGESHTRAVDDLSNKFDRMTSTVTDLVTDGLAARSNEIVAALSGWVGNDSSFTVKVANIPVNSSLYVSLAAMAGIEGNFGSMYTLDDFAIGSFRLSGYSDANAISLKEFFNDAVLDEYSQVKIRFEFDDDNTLASDEQLIELYSRQIKELQIKIDSLGKP